MFSNIRPALLATAVLASLTSITAVAPAIAQNVTEAQIRAILEKNPELVMNAIAKAQANEQTNRNAQLAASTKPVAARILAGDKKVAFLGVATGKPVIEFFDYNCGFCKKFSTETSTPLLASGAKVKLYLVHTPILGPGSERMAEFAVAAKLQNKFEGAHKFLIAQHASSLDDANALKGKLIAAAGLDAAKFERALSDGSAKAELNHNVELAKTAGVQGTPMIYANGQAVPGAIPLDALKSLIG